MKKRLAAALALVIVLSQPCVFAAQTAAEREEGVVVESYDGKIDLAAKDENVELYAETYGDFEYSINEDDTVKITGYNDSDTEVTIPSEIDGKKVTRIGWCAFEDCESLTSVTIPDSVTEIGSEAFRSCSSLESVAIGNSVTQIGYCTFQYCRRLTSVTIGNGVTTIGESAFEGCSLTSVTIPNSVTEIGWKAFYNCSDLTSITIPNSVTLIDGSAFYQCSSLKSVTIGNGVTEIGNLAFYDCIKLKSVTIPDSVTKIGENVFNKCSNLESIAIPNGVTKIDWGTFYDCKSLKSIIIPAGVTEIDSFAFYGCNNLTIYGYVGSYAETYANENDIPFVAIRKSDLNFNDVIVNKIKLSYVGDKVKVSVNISVEKESDDGFTLYVAGYNKYDEIVGIKRVSVTDNNYNDTVEFSASEKPERVKVFAIDAVNGASPLCMVQEIELN